MFTEATSVHHVSFLLVRMFLLVAALGLSKLREGSLHYSQGNMVRFFAEWVLLSIYT